MHTMVTQMVLLNMLSPIYDDQENNESERANSNIPVPVQYTTLHYKRD